MCGRYTLISGMVILQNRFGFSPDQGNIEPRYNLAPGQEVPVVIRKDGNLLCMMKWGLVPSWTKEPSIGYKMINARGETLLQKPSFRKSFCNRRCLILADSFYEWKRGGTKDNKFPIRFFLPNFEPFAFAGLWDTWKKPDGKLLYSCTIVTTKANALISPIHDRMPVILQPENEKLWLGPNLKDMASLTTLLKPYPKNFLRAYRVSSIVNSAKNDSPECIKPLVKSQTN